MAKKFLVYEIWAPSWPSLKEMQKHLFRIASLDVDCVWLSGVLKSPQKDHGYDVSDYRSIDPRYGSMEDFANFVRVAHRLDMKVIIDLVINHTSIEHPWFRSKPGYYCWNNNSVSKNGWKDLFSGGPAWQYAPENKSSYLHLFNYAQADLNWYPNPSYDFINWDLVDEFRRIVAFWTNQYGVDGFRIDAPQAINKDFRQSTLNFNDMIRGKKSLNVINAIFRNKVREPILIAEVFDPTFGEISAEYIKETPVDYVLNVSVKDNGGEPFRTNILSERLRKMSKIKGYMCDLESHDSPRFDLVNCANKDWIILQMFQNNIDAVCLYQGQELGLNNPTTEVLPDHLMKELDVQTAMKFARGASLDRLRRTSRANARIPISISEYEEQMGRLNSHYNSTRNAIRVWRTRLD